MAGLVLSDAEQALWDAFPTGRVATGGTVRAEVIARLLLGEREPVPGYVAALRLRSAVVTDVLELSGCEVPYAVAITDCVFEEAPALEAASTRLIDLSDSRLPALSLRDTRIDGQLRLTGIHCAGSLGLTRAHVSGSLDLNRAHLNGTPALHADSLLVDRDVNCRSADIRGELLMWSARVGGTFVLEGARITHPDGATLNGDGLVVEAGLFCGGGLTPDGLVSQGELRLQDARISRCCVFSGARLENPDGTAFSAERLRVEGILALDGGFRAEGRVVLEDASVDGSVDLTEARLHNPGKEALDAQRLQVRGQLRCGDLACDGEIVLNDAQVGTAVEFHAARLRNAGGQVLTARGLTTVVLDLCEGFTARGRVSLSGSRIGSQVCLAGAAVESVSLYKVTAGSLKTDGRTEFTGPVDLRHSRVDVLADDPARWPQNILLDGLTYDSLKAPLPVRSRLDWLAKEETGYLPQPYEQLAATYSRHGHDEAARDVLLAKHRRHRASQSPALRLWGYVQDWTVGYGYRPGRAAGWLAVLVLVATVAFAVREPPAGKPSEAPPFNSLLYGLDLLLPVVSFGQEGAFRPEGWQQWLAAALVAAGWILATTIAAGVTRVLARR